VLGADDELRGVLEMATAAEPARRYPSVEALRDDVLRYLENRPLRAAPDTAWYRARKFLRRNRWSSAAALLALLAAGMFVWRLGVERDRALAAEAHAIEQGAAAARAATTARRTLDYVVTIFGRANPERVLGRELTPRQLVDEAAQELELRLADEPGAQRAMQAVLGQVYGALGEPREALALLDSAIEGYRPDSREDALWLADVLSQRASAAQAADDFALAASAAAASAELRRQWAADDALQQLRALGDRARAATFNGDSAAALRLWNEAVAVARASADVAPELVDEQLLHLGAITSGLGAYQAADGFTAELLARLESRLPARHPAFIDALRQRGFVLSSLGRHAESEMMFERALALHREVLGDAGMTLSSLENDFGASLTLAGRFGSATRHMEKSVELMAAALGGEQFVDGVTLVNLGSTQEAVGDYRAAVRTMALAVQRLEQRRSPDDTEVWKARANHARALAFTGETARAVALMREVITVMQRIEGDESLWAAFIGIRLAQIERLAGDLQASRRTLEEAAPRFAKLLPPGHPALAQVHRLRGRLALETGDSAHARAEFETARGILATGEALPIDLAMIDVSLASVAMAEGRPDTARALLEPCLPVLRAELLPGEVNRAEAEALARRLNL
jgi:serine/threonine-protein kinase